MYRTGTGPPCASPVRATRTTGPLSLGLLPFPLQLFTLCEYPAILTPMAKGRLLRAEAEINMLQVVSLSRQEGLQRMLGGFYGSAQHLPRDPLELERVAPPRLSKGLGSGQVPGTPRGSGSFRIRAGRRDPSQGQEQQPRVGGPLEGLLQFVFGMAAPGIQLVIDQGQPASAAAAETDSGGKYPHALSPEDVFIARGHSGRLCFPACPLCAGELLPPQHCGVPPTHQDFCIVRARRTHLLEDALEEISRQRPRDLYKPLRVHFIGEEARPLSSFPPADRPWFAAITNK